MSNANQFNFDEPTFRCPTCGAEILPNSRNCTNCGQVFTRQESFGFPPYLQNNVGNQPPCHYPDMDNPYASPQMGPSGNGLFPLPVDRQAMIESIKSCWFLYMLFWVLSLLAILLIFGISSLSGAGPEYEISQDVEEPVFAFCGIVILVCAVASYIFGLILLHRLWSIIPQTITTVTPGRAVGFLFIPLFNLYWIFVAYFQLSRHYRDLTRASGQVSGHEFLSIIRCISGVLPWLNIYVTPLFNFFLLARLKSDALFVLEQYPEVPLYSNAQNGAYAPPQAYGNTADPSGSPMDNSVPPQLFPSANTDYSFVVPVNTSIFAIIAGYLGLFSVLILPAPFAILFGCLALRDIGKHPGLHGYGRAWFGIITGSLVLIGLAVFMGVALAFDS